MGEDAIGEIEAGALGGLRPGKTRRLRRRRRHPTDAEQQGVAVRLQPLLQLFQRPDRLGAGNRDGAVGLLERTGGGQHVMSRRRQRQDDRIMAALAQLLGGAAA